jgi:hypothetical protein
VRQVKQLLYGLLFITFWSAFIAGAYFVFFKPEPTCFDNKRNQDEEGIDCGGGCFKVCIPQAALLRVGDRVDVLPLATASGTVRVSFVGEVQNAERDFAARNFLYTFEALDENGSVLATFSDAAYLYPSEIRYVSAPNKVIPGGVMPSSARLTISNTDWVPSERMPRPKLVVNVSSARDEGATFTVRGTIANQDILPFEDVALLALIYDTEGSLLGVSHAELEQLSPGDPREFAIFHPPLSSIAPERTQVFATAYNYR